MKTFKKSKAIGFLMKISGWINLHVDPAGKGGRRPYDYVLMFKVMILQRYYNISDDQTEYQICDRLSFMRFLGLRLADDVNGVKDFYPETLAAWGLWLEKNQNARCRQSITIWL